MVNTRSQHALFANNSYGMIGKESKTERIKKINNNIFKTGFVVDRANSNRDILTLVNKKDLQLHIAHRGTDITGQRTKKDLISDFKIAVGKTKGDKQFKKRTKYTEKALNDHLDKTATASGHSLGGASLISTVATSKVARDRLTDINTFNTGSTIFGSKEIQRLSNEDKDILKDKITHHRTKNDIVSASLLVNPSIGTIKTYKNKTDKNPDNTKEISSSLGKAISGLDVPEILHSHSIEHFYDKSQYHD